MGVTGRAEGDDRDRESDERTTDVGLFHYANSYRRSADALGTAKLSITHPDAPRTFLYYHAIELYLKAFLRHAGCGVRELRKIGHDYGELSADFEANGGFIGDEDREILNLMQETRSVIRARYIETGAFTRPTVEALARTAGSLHETVRRTLKSAGRTVR